MTTCQGKTILLHSSQQLPHLCFGSLKGFCELIWRHSKALISPRVLLLELQRIKEVSVKCAWLGAEVPGHRKEQLTQTLIVRMLKTHLILLLQKFRGPWHPLATCLRPLRFKRYHKKEIILKLFAKEMLLQSTSKNIYARHKEKPLPPFFLCCCWTESIFHGTKHVR